MVSQHPLKLFLQKALIILDRYSFLNLLFIFIFRLNLSAPIMTLTQIQKLEAISFESPPDKKNKLLLNLDQWCLIGSMNQTPWRDVKWCFISFLLLRFRSPIITSFLMQCLHQLQCTFVFKWFCFNMTMTSKNALFSNTAKWKSAV